jgi:hypothetical protein
LQEDDCAGPALSPSALHLLSIIAATLYSCDTSGRWTWFLWEQSRKLAFLFNEFCLGTLLGKHQIEIWRFPLSLVEVIAGSEHNKQGAENTQKELQGKGRFSFFGTSGKDHGSFSLLPPRCPGLIEDRRADKKKTRRFSGRIFWAIHLPHPIASNVCPFFFSFPFYFQVTCLVPTSAGSL